MSRWGSAFRLIGSAVASFVSGNWGIFLNTLMMEDGRRRRDRATRAARDAYNNSLKDRLQMFDATADAPRRLVVGRVRVGGQLLRRPWSTGANKEKLTLPLEFAGHEIDAFETFYADDVALTLDGTGWVQTAPYFKTRTESNLVTGTLNGSGGATVTLPHTPLAPPDGSIAATWWNGLFGENHDSGSLAYSVAGNVVTLSGGPAGATYNVSYQYTTGTSLMRIRTWRGTPTQSVAGDVAAEYPGDMRATDHYRGIAMALVDVWFDSDVFTSGPPQISVVMRGARVFDPRTGTTAFSENPALLARWYALHPNGLGMPADELREADAVADANVCDTSTAFTLRKPGGSTEVVTLPRYRAGMVASTDADPRQVWGELLEAMAGRFGWQGGTLRVRCGALRPAVADIDESWVFRAAGDGAGRDDAHVRIANGTAREAKVNAVTGSCVDPSQRWQVLPFPRVADPVLIARQGSYPMEVELQAVNHIAHAQHLGTLMIRQSQASLRMEMQTGLTGYRCELLDVVTLSLPRYGMKAKTMEVTGWRWHPTEGVSLKLAEITDAMFVPVAELAGRDPAPDSNLPLPWEVPRVTGVAVTSNTAQVADGSVITRLVVTWNPVAELSVASSGEIEVQYHDLTLPLPAGDWASWPERGNATRAVIPGVAGGHPYAVRVRAVRGVPYVRGDWSALASVIAAAKRVPRVYRQADPPTGAGVLDGDEWFETDNGNRYYLRVAGAWVPLDVGTGGLAPGAATEVFRTTGTSGVTVTGVYTSPDGFASVRNTLICTVSFTAAADGEALLVFDAQGYFVNSTAALSGGRWSIQDQAASWDSWRRVEKAVQASQTDIFPAHTTRRFAVVKGVAYTFGVYASKLNPGDTFVVENHELRAEVVYR